MTEKFIAFKKEKKHFNLQKLRLKHITTKCHYLAEYLIRLA